MNVRLFRLFSSSSIALLLTSTVCWNGCKPPSTVDITAPRVLSISPFEQIIAVDAAFEIQFSEAMEGNESVLNLHTAVLVETSEASEAFVNDVDIPPLLDSRLPLLVPLDIVLSADGTRLVLRPLTPLSTRTRYTLLLSEELTDLEGNPLVNFTGLKSHFRFDFTTNDGPPTVLSHDVPNGTNDVVPTNRRRFTIWMDQPVQGADKESISLELAAGGGDVSLASIVLDETRSAITLILDDVEGCERMAPNAEHVIAFSSGISDDQGESMVPFHIPFTTGASCQTERNQVVGTPLAVAGDVSATISFVTNHESTTKVWFGLSGGALDCDDSLPCPVVGEAAIAPSEPGRFVHSAQITGLVVSQTYDFYFSSEDDFGSAAVGEGSFTTAPLAKVSINEILADAVGTDSTGEFIEIHNFGDVVVDLSGFSILVNDDKDCFFPDDGSAPILDVGEYVVVVGTGFDASLFLGLNETDVYVMSGSTGACGGLINDPAPMVFRDADERPISSYSGYLDPKTGVSVERLSSSVSDAAGNFCYSRTESGPTPGRQNSVTLSGCEAD
ncbi:MAG: hypothetical protein GY822_02345 [Deltaproteobacteria bacterium]|nr:hypothetical protein [Deltaproteobacteria bacterium]